MDQGIRSTIAYPMALTGMKTIRAQRGHSGCTSSNRIRLAAHHNEPTLKIVAFSDLREIHIHAGSEAQTATTNRIMVISKSPLRPIQNVK